jgi:hypothetical protein
MRRIAGLVTLAALALTAAPAVAAPPVTEEFDCGGVATSIRHPTGTNAWIGDQHYVVASFSFTPDVGATETVSYGKKSGLSGALTCTQPLPGGVFSVVLLPVPPGR